MGEGAVLRRQILAALTSSSLLAGLGVGCETPGEAEPPRTPVQAPPSGTSPAAPVSCGPAPVTEQCFAPFSNMDQSPEVPFPSPPSQPSFDANGCAPTQEVADGCCNNPVAGPRFDGSVCCYQFCTVDCCGRPLLVAGEARRAESRRRDDWCGRSVGQGVETLDAPTRARLARAWLEDARMEHASIASFARFTLQLLALAAPPELVAEAQRAGLDEVRHARDCFALATRFGGKSVGPGPLDLTGALMPTSLLDAAEDAFREGCIGESVAAIVARHQLDGARDPQVQRILSRIARDEARHAELAWRFVAWASSRLAPADRAVLFARLDAIASLDVAPSGGDGPGLGAYGRLDARARAAACHEALEEVVRPCLRRLTAA